MNNRFYVLVRKAFFAASLTMICGGFTACKDDYTLDDEGNYPTWLGGSIYETLKNPSSVESSGTAKLSGTFNNYVKLIEDLGEAETLGKTGSKTVFPANDEAFERFFASNNWGISKYEDLTKDQKKRLLYSSMLDNALLVEMLSNVSDGSTAVLRGQAMRHSSAINVINTIKLWDKDNQPKNNPYWAKYANKSIHAVSDATDQTIIHFTEEQMTANSITTRGENSDFEVITGAPYDATTHSAYVFRNKIIGPDITCKNGYIHQMEDVLVPPGNMAEVIRENDESSLFSRMLDRFSAPYYNSAVTKNYNDYAQANNIEQIDSIFEMRYLSSSSQGSELKTDPNGNEVIQLLPYDPGWNSYNVGGSANMIKDIAVMFVPTNEALQKYFLPKGEGAFLIETFGKYENTAENLPANIDSIPLQNIKQLLNNLMKESFIGTVPSKFGHVMDEANDPMGLTLDVLNKNSDNTYDVKIANNGVIYMLNKMFGPPSLVAVSAPVSLNNTMQIMNKAVYDGQTSSALGLGLNYYAYLLAMSANYAFFIPNDEAFGKYYVDPAYLVEDEPRALRFFYKNTSPYVFCSAWKYDKKTGMVGDSIGMVSAANFRSQLTDILNYHTVVLASGERMGRNGNRYYKTKHGGALVFDSTAVVMTVNAGKFSINGEEMNPTVQRVFNQKNGASYELNQVIQAPQQSVYSVITGNSQFSEFSNLCNWHFDIDDGEEFSADKLMEFASDRLVVKSTVTNKYRWEAYQTFVAKNGLDYNVNYFNSYNYTVFAPNNEAMSKAYALGLPTWNDIKAIYDQYYPQFKQAKDDKTEIPAEVQAARDQVLAMIYEVNNFVRYHFQDNSVFVDKIIETGEYPTASSDTLGIREKLVIDGGNGAMTVTDHSGQTIPANTSFCNQLTRDYVLNKTAHSIATSSFAVVHEISTPLSTHVKSEGGDNGRYDYEWVGKLAASRLKAFRKKFDNGLYKLYDSTLEY